MTRRIAHVGVVFLVLYGLLFFRLEIIQVLNADTLRSHPQNTREITLVFDEPRGFIRTADGEIIAQTVAVSGRQGRLRQYPYGPLYSHVAGFISAENGGSGLERTQNEFLGGEDLGVRLQDNRDLFIDRSRTGQLELSIRHDIQLITRAAMAGQVGAAVVLNPTTGSVLGLWSAPQFDPNHLSSHDLIAVTSDYQALSSDPNQPLLNRAEFQSYDIGSLFTIVTAAAAIEEELRDFVVPPIERVTSIEGSHAIVHDGGPCGGRFTVTAARRLLPWMGNHRNHDWSRETKRCVTTIGDNWNQPGPARRKPKRCPSNRVIKFICFIRCCRRGSQSHSPASCALICHHRQWWQQNATSRSEPSPEL